LFIVFVTSPFFVGDFRRKTRWLDNFIGILKIFLVFGITQSMKKLFSGEKTEDFRLKKLYDYIRFSFCLTKIRPFNLNGH